MADRIERYLRDLQMKQNLWLGGPCANYSIAYTLAHQRYKQTLDTQVQADKQQAEMFVLAASIATSTVLMASLASASLRVLAGRAALQVICNNNLNRTFEALHMVSNNKAAMFALGAVLDAVKSDVSKRIKDAAQTLSASASGIVAPSPLIQKTQIDQFVYLNTACAQATAAAVQDDRTMSTAERNSIIDMLEQAPIFNPPVGKINEEALADRIELSFYMSSIMDSDFLVDMPEQYNGLGGAFAAALKTTEKPITQLPSAPDYPKSTRPSQFVGGRSGHKLIRVARMGSHVEGRIDDLHKKVFQTNFYSGGNSSNARSTGPHPDLIKAERTLIALGESTRPLRMDSVRV